MKKQNIPIFLFGIVRSPTWSENISHILKYAISEYILVLPNIFCSLFANIKLQVQGNWSYSISSRVLWCTYILKVFTILAKYATCMEYTSRSSLCVRLQWASLWWARSAEPYLSMLIICLLLISSNDNSMCRVYILTPWSIIKWV